MRFKVSKPGCGDEDFKVLGEFDDFAMAILFKTTYNEKYLGHAEVFDSLVSMEDPVLTCFGVSYADS